MVPTMPLFNGAPHICYIGPILPHFTSFFLPAQSENNELQNTFFLVYRILYKLLFIMYTKVIDLKLKGG